MMVNKVWRHLILEETLSQLSFDQPLQFHRPPIPHVLLAASAVLGQLYDLRSTVARTGRNILKEKCRHQK